MRDPAARLLRVAGLAAGIALVAAGAHLVTAPRSLRVADAGQVPRAVASAASSPAGVGATGVAGPAGGASGLAPPQWARRQPGSTLPVALVPPVRLSGASLGLSAPVVPIAVLPGGALDLPPDPRTVGWWAGSALPGSDAGSVVVAGHVDTASAGLGALARVAQAPLGSVVGLTDATGEVHDYRLTARRTVGKGALPADAFRSDGPPQLAMVTCGGPFDAATHHYRDNVVVYAVPVDGG